jgi:hypothetical protein
MTTHHDFEGLAAGYALHALEPEDEQLLAAHLLTCRSCVRLVADTAVVTTAFAEALPVETPPPGLRDAILRAAEAEPRGRASDTDLPVSPPAPGRSAPAASARDHSPSTRPRRTQTRLRVAIGALAAAVGIAVAVPVTLAVSDTGNGTGAQTPLAVALLQPGAHAVSLTGSGAAAKSAVARAVVSDKGIYFLADGLPANDAGRTVYVLWAANTAGQLSPVATFDVHTGKPVQVAATQVPYQARDISMVAVSFEPGRAAPAKPSDVVLSSKSA